MTSPGFASVLSETTDKTEEAANVPFGCISMAAINIKHTKNVLIRLLVIFSSYPVFSDFILLSCPDAGQESFVVSSAGNYHRYCRF